MDNKISTDKKAELVQVLRIQYRKSSKREKTRILDQFIAISGYHRKHAIRLLRCETGNDTKHNNSSITNRSRRRSFDCFVRGCRSNLWKTAQSNYTQPR